jgi:hypothetical protein
MERLRIENFAGMEDVELDIGRFNVFIGPQAAGKSVCAKLLYFFKDLPSEMASAIVEDQGPEELQQRLVEKFESFFPSAFLGTANFRITYTTDGAEMSIQRSEASSGGLTVRYSQPLLDAFENAIHHHKKLLKALLRDNFDMDLDEVENRVEESFYESLQQTANPGIANSQFFIPAGRSFFATVERTIFGLLKNNAEIDPFLMEFGSYYETVKKLSQMLTGLGIKPPSGKPEVNKLATQVLCGEHLRRENRDFIHLPDGRTIGIAYASSGQQEALPLALILQDVVLRDYKPGGATLYIEEPEAHLFPSAQQAIVPLIATVFNLAKSNLQFVITTHSPYILTAFDNLLKAGQVEQLKNGDDTRALYDIVPKEQILHTKDFRGYLLQGGHAQNLMDAETGLLVADAIDGVSDELMVQFEQLMDLED